jgi:glycosyltransferase involved in cell wall biosynthesis
VNPKITIVTPSYNQGQYLEETIDSVLSQGYDNLEYMVLDGGSTDNSVEIIRKYAKHLAWWVSEKDNGQTDAILKGMHRMTGDVFNWINSDDLLATGSLQEVGDTFKNSEITCLSGPILMFGKKKEKIHAPVYQEGNSLIRTFGLDNYNQPGTYFSAKAIRKFGLPNIRLHYVMDKEWFMRYLLHFGIDSIRVTDKILACYREHAQTKTASMGDVFMDEYAAVIRSYCHFYNAKKLADLIDKKYPKGEFEVDPQTPHGDIALIHQLVGVFLLRRYNLINTRQDYEFAVDLCKNVDWLQCDLDINLISRLKELSTKVKAENWWRYKLKTIFR